MDLVTLKPLLRRASTDDGSDILAIYNQSIQRGEIARHTNVLSMSELAGALLPNEDRYHTYVAPVDGVVRGWAGFRPWHLRNVYPWTLELLVYVAPTHRGRGLGKALVNERLPRLRARITPRSSHYVRPTMRWPLACCGPQGSLVSARQ